MKGKNYEQSGEHEIGFQIHFLISFSLNKKETEILRRQIWTYLTDE